jgi:hypothetical protein
VGILGNLGCWFLVFDRGNVIACCNIAAPPLLTRLLLELNAAPIDIGEALGFGHIGWVQQVCSASKVWGRILPRIGAGRSADLGEELYNVQIALSTASASTYHYWTSLHLS